jgi:hypothetical protein
VSKQASDEPAEETTAPTAAEPRPASAPGVPEDEPVLPDRGADDTDQGWGEPPEDDDPDDRLRREVPPHW